MGAAVTHARYREAICSHIRRQRPVSRRDRPYSLPGERAARSTFPQTYPHQRADNSHPTGIELCGAPASSAGLEYDLQETLAPQMFESNSMLPPSEPSVLIAQHFHIFYSARCKETAAPESRRETRSPWVSIFAAPGPEFRGTTSALLPLSVPHGAVTGLAAGSLQFLSRTLTRGTSHCSSPPWLRSVLRYITTP